MYTCIFAGDAGPYYDSYVPPASPAQVRRGRGSRQLRGGHPRAAGLPVQRVRVPGDWGERDPALQPGVRGGPVQPEHRVGEAGREQLLQLVLLHLHLRDDGVADGDRVRAVERELGDRAGHTGLPHVSLLRLLLRWHEDLRDGAAPRQPHHQRRSDARRRLQEEETGTATSAVGFVVQVLQRGFH